MYNDNTFWLKDIHSLFSQFDILPNSKNSVSKNLNNITRLVLIIFIILVLCKSPYAILFLVISLIVIIVVYFLFNKKNNDELLKNEHFNEIDLNEIKKSFNNINIDNINNTNMNKNNNKNNKNNNNKIREGFSDNVIHNASDFTYNNNETSGYGPGYRNGLKIMKTVNENNRGELCDIEYPNKPYVNGKFLGNKAGYVPYRISNEDLYQQGANVYDTYNASNMTDDGSCCNMKTPHKDEEYWIPKYYSPNLGVNPKSLEPPHLSPRTVEEGYWSMPTASNANTQVVTDLEGEVDIYIDKKHFEKPECNNKALLLEETPTRMYTEAELNTPNNQLFLTTIEPHVYSYDDRIIGINSNSGITYTPEDEPLVRNKVCTNALENYPIYTSNTPQFVRNDVMPIQEEFQPKRSNWSQLYKGQIQPGAGTINFEDIYKDWPSTDTMRTEGRTYLNCKNPKEGFNDEYAGVNRENYKGQEGDLIENGNSVNERTMNGRNMRDKIVDRMMMYNKKEQGVNNMENYQEMSPLNYFTPESDGDSINFPNNDPENTYDPRSVSYGDVSRGYSDINLGQVNYYYSDINAHRQPVFFTRNSVDHLLFTDPQGKTTPYYQKTASLDDVKDYVENDWLAKTSVFREDLMSLQMRKKNSELLQLRISPLSRAAHTSTFTNKY